MNDNNEELIIPNNIKSINLSITKIRQKFYNLSNKIDNINENIDFINNDINEINEKINSEDGNIKTGTIETQVGYLNVNIEDTDEPNRIVNKKYVDDKYSGQGNVDFNGQNDFKTSPCSITSQGSIKIVGFDGTEQNPNITLNSDGTVDAKQVQVGDSIIYDNNGITTETINITNGTVSSVSDNVYSIVNKKYVDENGGGIDPEETLELKVNSLSITAAGSVYVGYDYDVDVGNRAIELNKDGNIYLGDNIETQDEHNTQYKAIELNNDGSIYAGFDENNTTPINPHQYKRGMIIEETGNVNIKSGIIRDTITNESSLNSIINKSYVDNNFINKIDLVKKTGEDSNKVYTQDKIDETLNNYLTETDASNTYATKETVNSIINGTTPLNSVNVNSKASIDNNGNISGVSLEVSGDISGTNITSSSYKVNNNTFAVNDNSTNKTNLQNINIVSTDKLSISNTEISGIQTGTNDNVKLTTKGYIDDTITALTTNTITPIQNQVNSLDIQVDQIEQQLSEIGQSYFVYEIKTSVPSVKDTEVIFCYDSQAASGYEYILMEWIENISEYKAKSVPNNTTCIVKDDSTYIKSEEDTTGQKWIKNAFKSNDTLYLTNEGVSMVASGNVKVGSNEDNPNILLEKSGNITSKGDIITNTKIKINCLENKYLEINLDNTNKSNVKSTEDISIYKGTGDSIGNNNGIKIDDNGVNVNCNLISNNDISSSSITTNSINIDSQTITGIQTGTNDNVKLTTKGYVDDSVSSISESVTSIETKLNSLVDNSGNISGNSLNVNSKLEIDSSGNVNRINNDTTRTTIINNNGNFSGGSITGTSLDVSSGNISGGSITGTSFVSSGNISGGNIEGLTYKTKNSSETFAENDNTTNKTNLQNINLISTDKLSINNTEITGIQTGTDNNDKLTTKGYVNDTINSSINSITSVNLTSGTIDKNEFTQDKDIINKKYVNDNYVSKSDLVKKTGEDTSKVYTQDKIDETLNSYLTKTDASNTYATKETVNSIINGTTSLDSVNVNSKASIDTNGNISGVSLDVSGSISGGSITGTSITLNSKLINDISTSSSSVSSNKDNNLTTQGYVDSSIETVSNKLNGIVDNSDNITGTSFKTKNSSDTFAVNDNSTNKTNLQNINSINAVSLTSSGSISGNTLDINNNASIDNSGNISGVSLDVSGSIESNSLNVNSKLELDSSGNVNRINNDTTKTTIINNNGNINGENVIGTTFKTKNSSDTFAVNDNSTNKTNLQNINSITTDTLYLRVNSTSQNSNNKTFNVNSINSNFNLNNVNINKTIIHNILIDGNIESYHIGEPVFLLENQVYSLENIDNNVNCLYKYVKVNKNNYLKNSTNQVPKITSKNNGKFIGIITSIYPKNTLINIDNVYIKIDDDTIDFASHGDYVFKVNNNTIKHKTTSGESKTYEIGDEILYDGTIVNPEVPLSRKLEKMIVGTITYIPEDNIEYVSVFKL